MITTEISTLTVESPAFRNNDFIPSDYTCKGRNISPALKINNLPQHTISITLIMDDPDAPGGTYDHWIVWNIPPTKEIELGSLLGIPGRNSRNEHKYTGPCPPPGKVHHYRFKIFALDTTLDVSQDIDKISLINTMEGHVVAFGELIGLYQS